MGIGAGSWRVIVAAAIALPVGCVFASGGLGPADTTGSSAGGGGVTSSTTTSTSSAAGGGMGGAGTTSSSTSSTTTSSSTTTTSSSSTTTSSSSSTTTSSSSTSSSGGCTPSSQTICCGDVPCDISTSQCCITQGPFPNPTCVSQGIQCPTGSATFKCDDGSDCPGNGNVCCAHWNGIALDGTVQCQGQNNCTPPTIMGGVGDYPICDYPNGACPGGMTCHEAPTLGQGHGYCF